EGLRPCKREEVADGLRAHRGEIREVHRENLPGEVFHREPARAEVDAFLEPIGRQHERARRGRAQERRILVGRSRTLPEERLENCRFTGHARIVDAAATYTPTPATSFVWTLVTVWPPRGRGISVSAQARASVTSSTTWNVSPFFA